MDNIARIDIKIPDVTATFVGTKEIDGFANVLNDFPEAKEVRILTYSNIGGKSNKAKRLRELSPETNVHIVIALPGLYQKGDNVYSVGDIATKLNKIKDLFDLKLYAGKNVEISVCFKNHAKLIGTENILYIGSANYSDFSHKNYEAGMIIRDKEVIRKIYDEFFDEIIAVRYYGDGYDDIRLELLAVMDALIDLDLYIDEFVEFFDERAENIENIQGLNTILFSMIKDLVKKLESYEENLIEDVLNEIIDIQDMLSTVMINIDNAFDSDYDKGIEYFANYYENSHMEKMGVYCSDAWIDENTPYIPLYEEPLEDQISYIEDYWKDKLQNKPEVIETKNIVRDSYKKVKELISIFQKSSFELFELELIKVGTDKNALK